ncbi:MAG TPA: TonB-dependent receptor plug domain-containing protein [Opitutaceae bacterium]|nr:TonB-dependent receptor plug domain-containing protein [Opitutaceae bacterium]
MKCSNVTAPPLPPRPASLPTRTPRLSRSLVLLAASAFALSNPTRGWAQTAPATDDTTTASDEPALKLDPFTVSAQTEGYKAVDTLGGARVQTKLVDTPSALSVVTKALLDDTGITDAQQLLVYTTDTEVAGLNGNFSGVSSRGTGVSSNAEAGRLLNPNSINRARGISPMDNTRNYFGSEIPWDSFNISRVDISRGPNSFLFGVGSPSGIANYSTNEAIFKDEGTIEARVGSFGTTRESLDYNKVIIPGQLAVRIDLLNNDTQYQQKPAFNHAKRAYAALRYEPKFLDTPSSHFKLEANAEAGRVRSNNPRELPPMDFITGYFSGGGLNKGGYDPFTYNTGQQLTGAGSFSGTGGAPAQPSLNPWVNAQDYHYIWPGPNAAYWYDATTGSLLQSMTTLNGPLSVSGNGATIGGFPQAAGLYTSGFANYARTINYRNPSLAPGAYAGTVFYNDKSITDSSIYNFYNKLIDGPNKQEWQNWKAFNLTAEETLFNGRLALQGVIDHQEFDEGQAGLFGYTEPFISVDLDAYNIQYPSWYSSLAVKNPNVGRAFVASDTGGGDNSTKYVHDNYQVTANYDLRAEDFLPKGPLADFLGHHSLTGLLGQYTTNTETRSWSGFATDLLTSGLLGAQSKINDRSIDWVSYLGPNMINTASASGLNLNNIANTIWPTSGTIMNFNTTWTAGAGVNPTDPWTDPSPYATGTSTQANNPANYKGWTATPVNVENWKQNISDLYQSGSKTQQVLDSAAFMYQGHLLDDVIIPEFGWRRDTLKQRAANAPLDPNTAVASMNYGITGPTTTFRTTSTSWGVTLHLPKSIRGKLPGGSDVSLYYFRGNNETPKIRYAFDTSALPAESGRTDDYGVQLDTLNGHATIRLTYFKTLDQNAQAGSGAADPLGNNGYYLYLLPAWGAADAAASGLAVAAYPAAANDGGFTSHPDDSSNTIHNLQVAAVNDWKANFAKIFPQSFFDAYGMGVNVNAITTGNWANVYNQPNAVPVTYPWNIANTGGGKINGSFPIISQDIESKGYELEATVRPVDNWDLTFNASKIDAYQTALGAADSAFIEKEYQFFNGPAGNLPLWGYWGGGVDTSTTPYSMPLTSTLKGYFIQNIWSAYQLQTAQTGAAQPELRKWNFKAITNYRFVSGALKGFNIGGGVRWASKPILGYGISQFTDPTGATGWIMDVKKPIYGTIDEHADMWVGYQRKLNERLTWRVQFNVRNLGERPHLVPVSVEPDGTWAQERIETGETYELTTKLMF